MEPSALEQLFVFEPERTRRPGFFTAIAQSEAEVIEAQRLRYRVFAEEIGAAIPDNGERIDRDEFDPYCEHLIVRERETGLVVGTYRILTAAQAVHTGGFYSAREFHLDGLAGLAPHTVEIGRACVDPAYRTGAVIATLWAGLALHLQRSGYEYVIGCASVPLSDGGRLATSVYHRVRLERLSPPEWRVRPRCPFPLASEPLDPDPAIPTLLKGYLRLGAYVCGDPAWDAAFGSADLLLILPLARMNPRYANRFARQR